MPVDANRRKLRKYINNLEDCYVLEDGHIENFVIDKEKKIVRIKVFAPIFKLHPKYWQVDRWLRRYFSSGIYLNDDGRKINFIFEGCEISELKKHDEPLENEYPSRISHWRWYLSASQELNFSDYNIEVRFSFTHFCYAELKE